MVISSSLKTEITRHPCGNVISFSIFPSKLENSGKVIVQILAFPLFKVASKCIPAKSTSCSINLVIISVLLTTISVPKVRKASTFLGLLARTITLRALNSFLASCVATKLSWSLPVTEIKQSAFFVPASSRTSNSVPSPQIISTSKSFASSIHFALFFSINLTSYLRSSILSAISLPNLPPPTIIIFIILFSYETILVTHICVNNHIILL